MKFFVLTLLLVAVVYLIYALYPLLRAHKIGITLQEQSISYTQDPESVQQNILVAGDSTGVGTGASDPAESIAGRLGQMYPNARIENISENGLRLAGLLEKLEALPEDAHYDLIMLQIGANDVVQQTEFSSIEEVLEQVLALAELHANNVVLLTAGNIGIAPIFVWPISDHLTSRTLATREIFIRTIAEHPTIYYVDLFATREDDVFSTDIKRYYAEDKFHPSGAGYGEWFRSVEEVIVDNNLLR